MAKRQAELALKTFRPTRRKVGQRGAALLPATLLAATALKENPA